MPLYEFKCEACGQVAEELRPMASMDEAKECPACGGQARRIVSRTSFRLTGGGWFADGYQKGKR